MLKINSGFDAIRFFVVAATVLVNATASHADPVQTQAVTPDAAIETTDPTPAQSPSWVPNEIGRRWTYVYIAERSRTRAGEVAEFEKVKGTRTDTIVADAPDLGADVFRLESTTIGRAEGETVESTERQTNFYRADGSKIELVAEQQLDPTTGTAPLIEYEVPLSLLEAGASPGQRWKVGVRSRGDLHTDLEGEILGRQDAQTPLGMFEDCLAIRLTGQTTGVVEVYGQRMEVPSGDYSVTRWYAPGVGLVLAKEQRSRTLVRDDGETVEYSERAQFALRSAEPGTTPVPAAGQ